MAKNNQNQKQHSKQPTKKSPKKAKSTRPKIHHIVGTVTEVIVKKTMEIKIKGCGNYLVKNDKGEIINNILLDEKSKNCMQHNCDETYTIPLDEFSKILLAMATVNQKPLKFEINDSFAITSISLLNA